jgi:hypothetical protein
VAHLTGHVTLSRSAAISSGVALLLGHCCLRSVQGRQDRESKDRLAGHAAPRTVSCTMAPGVGAELLEARERAASNAPPTVDGDGVVRQRNSKSSSNGSSKMVNGDYAHGDDAQLDFDVEIPGHEPMRQRESGKCRQESGWMDCAETTR